MYDLLMDNGTGKRGVPADITMEYAVKHLENADGKVRDMSKKILVQLHSTLGEAKLRPFLVNLRSK